MNSTLARRVFCALSGALLAACATTNYSEQMQKAFESTFKGPFKNYQYYGMPVSGYGVGTMYPKAAKNSDFDPTTSGIYGEPNTWWKTGMTSEEQKQRFVDLFGSAETGSIAFQNDKTTQFDLDVVLPGLYNLVSADTKDEVKRSVKVTVSASTAFNHRINWDQFASDLRDGTIKPDIKVHYLAGDSLITIADIVLNDYQASLVTSGSLSVSAKAQLTSAWRQFSNGSNAAFNFSDASSGNFTVKAKQPVVIAVYIGQPPGSVTLAAAPPSFIPIQLPTSVLDRISDASLHQRGVPIN